MTSGPAKLIGGKSMDHRLYGQLLISALLSQAKSLCKFFFLSIRQTLSYNLLGFR
jgi:hypothetical protein